MSLPAEIIPLLEAFRPAFTNPTYRKVLVLLLGTVLAQGRRTVTAALHVMGYEQQGDWSKYHHVLNRNRWNGLRLSRILLQQIVKYLVIEGSILYLTVDETLERRWGPQIRKRGHWRDSLASGRKLNVSSSGIRWLVFAVAVHLPWTPYTCALPFLCLPLTTPKVSAKLGHHHRTVAKRTMQVLCWVRRQLPGWQIHLMGDGAYSVIELGLRAQVTGIPLIAPLRLDARLFEEPATRPRVEGKKRPGRPALVGARLATLAEVAANKNTRWQRSRLAWYGGETEVVDCCSGVALWYSTGTAPLRMRWVLVRDPKGERNTVAFFSTDIHQLAPTIVTDFVKRWAHEVTFEEVRAHLGFETQRQWSDIAVERTTPALFAVFSLVILMALAFYPNGQLPFTSTAWYPKSHATFHDVLAVVRRRLWTHLLFQTGAFIPHLGLFQHPCLQRLLSAVAY